MEDKSSKCNGNTTVIGIDIKLAKRSEPIPCLIVEALEMKSSNFKKRFDINFVTVNCSKIYCEFYYFRYKDTLKDLKQTRMLLQETERKREELDTFNIKIKMELRNSEMNFDEQLNASKKKVNELTTKLQTTERRLRRLDKRRSSGLCYVTFQITLALD